MELTKFLSHFSLDENQLELLLKDHGLKADLKEIEVVPDNWIALMISLKHKNSKRLKPDPNFLSRSLVESPIVAEPQEVLLDDLNKVDFDAPDRTQIRASKRYDRPVNAGVANKSKKEYFLAFVKFVDSEKTHGYVKRLNNLQKLDADFLHSKDDNDYFINVEGASLEKEQVIICSSKFIGPGKKKAIIEAVTFTGAVKKSNTRTKIYDLSSRLSPQDFIIPLGSFPKISSDTVISFSIFIFKGHINAVQFQNAALQVPLNEFGNIGALKRFLKQDVLPEENLELIKILISVIDNKTEVIKSLNEAFHSEKERIKSEFGNLIPIDFLDKWLKLYPEILTLQNLDFENATKFYMERWLEKGLPYNFWGDNLIPECSIYLTKISLNEVLVKCLSLKKLLSDDFYNQIINTYFDEVDTIISSDQYLLLLKVADTLEVHIGEKLKASMYFKLNGKLKLELWLEDFINEFPHFEAIEFFTDCSPVQQDKIAENLNESGFKRILNFLTLTNSQTTLERAREEVTREILQNLSPISLDIESDGNEIFEIAWGKPEKWHFGLAANEIKESIGALQAKIVLDNPLLVGHNIIDFDLPILEDFGQLAVNINHTWDTLLVEILLSPECRTYALQTNHHALDDAKLGLSLFINQVLRIIYLTEETWNFIKPFFFETTKTILDGLRSTHNFSWLNTTEINEEKFSFLRPQPDQSSLLLNLNNKISASSANLKVILAATDFWEELSTIPRIEFYSKDNSSYRFRELDEAKILDQLPDNSFEFIASKRFFSNCSNTGIRPLVVNLSPILNLRLSKIVDIAGSSIIPSEPDWQIEQISCLDIHELSRQEESLLQVENVEIFVVEPDLITLTFKILLKELSLNYIIENPAIKHLWIKFSGGQSFIDLTKEQALSLGVEIPEGVNNFWIEKYGYGKYRVWGNYNWENHLEGFYYNECITIINREDVSFTKDQASYLVVDQKKLQNEIGITRFNPETIYRSRYWVVQKELVEGILRIEKEKKPLVLLIQRRDELEAVQQYFQAMGYYIPASEVALGRRLELLHQRNTQKKILIASVSDASQIINANYLGPLNVAWDSFNLFENYHLAKGSELFNRSITDAAETAVNTPLQIERESIEEETNNISSTESNSYLQRDIFFLLELQIPLINRLRSLLLDDNPASKLWLLDARIEDFASLEEKWKAKKVTFKVWSKKEDYDRDAEIADACILSPKPDHELPFSTEEAKEILRSVFLPENAQWHDYQIPYLDNILPAKNNLLVSLPTGGGKSLLFQAPALFRSSFTNRLTIVITPLKALMEDQVKALWDLGFYGSVDYINQDKSTEVLHIYRRLAGGEISLLFITPERFRSGGFIKAFSQRFENDGGLEYAVYDEAHCISQWGHEFRPDYLYSGKAVERFKAMNERKFPVLLFSATVSEKIYRDLNLIFK